MVKLYSICILYKTPDKVHPLKAAYDLSSFSYFQRSSVQEFMTFTSQLIVERTDPITQSSIREQDYMCHVYVRPDSLSGVILSDHEYPHRVAHNLIKKVLEEFANLVPNSQWVGNGSGIQFKALDVYLAQYQNPREVDAMSKIQADLDETKIILHNTIENVLQRGEKLDDLVCRSEDLSMQSKAFYKTAKKTNQCCVII